MLDQAWVHCTMSNSTSSGLVSCWQGPTLLSFGIGGDSDGWCLEVSDAAKDADLDLMERGRRVCARFFVYMV